MLQVISDPMLLDFIRVAVRMPLDQCAHFTAMTGQPYDVDNIAIGNFTVPGYRWAIKFNDMPLAVGGFALQRPGVYRDFFLSTPEAFSPQHYFPVTRICRRLMDAMLLHDAHRIECIVPAARVEGAPKLAKWYKILGYQEEALHEQYCADGTNALCYARVRR